MEQWASVRLGQFTGLSQRAPMGKLQPTFTTFASQYVSTSYCDAAKAVSGDYSRFFAAFNLKYDIPVRPSHRSYLTPSNASFVVAKNVLFKLYLDHAFRIHDMLDEEYVARLEDREPVEIVIFTKDRAVESVSQGVQQGVFEVLTSIVRIAYAKYVFDHWDTRTKWKFLKAAPQSVFRKFAKFGVLGLRKAYEALVRGSLLQRAAESTVELSVRLPLRLALRKPKRPEVYIARSVAAEAALFTVRTLVVAGGGAVGLTLAYYGGILFHSDMSRERWSDSDKNLPRLAFWLYAGSTYLADTLVGLLFAPELIKWVDEAV